VRRGQLLERHGTRLVKPAQIGGKICQRGFDQHPSAGLRNLPEPLQNRRIEALWRRLREAIEIGVRFEAGVAGNRACSFEQLEFRRVATDRRQQRQLLERPLE
jgi:hypothetical protein